MTEIIPPPHPDPDRKKVLNVYAILGAGLILGFIPTMLAAGLCLLFMLVALIAAYMIRIGSLDDSLAQNHMTYIIRTIWIGSFISIITLSMGIYYMLQVVDNAPLQLCIENIMSSPGANAGSINSMMLNQDYVMNLFNPCMNEFLTTNARALMISMGIIVLPIVLYFAVRYFRGLMRALRGYRLSKPEGWF